MLGLVAYETQVCECGLHESLASTDPDLELVLPVCPVCAGLAKQMRILEATDEAALKSLGEDPRPSAPRPADGRRVQIRFKSTEESGTA